MSMTPLAPSPTFGALLRGYRAAAGLSQEQLAERAGLSVRAISDLERGARTRPYPATVDRLAAALDLAPADRDRLASRVVRARPGAASPAPADPAAAPLRWPSLPVAATVLIGREREVAEICALLRREGARLVTLTGAGGVGKTRLALEVSARLRAAFADGVCLVELAAVADRSSALQAIAAALGQPEDDAPTTLAALVDALPGERLLVLDNCEHVLDACAQIVATVLRDRPRLRVLATSRRPVGVAGERQWPVPPLPTPPLGASPGVRCRRYPAVRLFCERARDVLPGFALTVHNAAAVVEICRRLDGLPLAIELAAAWVKALTVQQIARRLDDRFRLLTRGDRAAPPHQRTLRATVEWSYGLLAVDERRLLNRLSALDGGWDLDAAEAIGGGDGIDPAAVLGLLGRLVEASLVEADTSARARAATARYRLLETIRQYAREQLDGSPEAATVYRRRDDWLRRRWEEGVLRAFVVDGRVAVFPASRKKRAVILRWLASKFSSGACYDEEEVNAILAGHQPDHATLRRELISSRLLRREAGRYWRPTDDERPDGERPPRGRRCADAEGGPERG